MSVVTKFSSSTTLETRYKVELGKRRISEQEEVYRLGWHLVKKVFQIFPRLPGYVGLYGKHITKSSLQVAAPDCTPSPNAIMVGWTPFFL